ncbi:MAG: ArgE/DapE family deacylase [Anaerolineales bacterium]|nr:MAG: ArgE/DapE family deacylase [Anaerolineales bacterium]
MGQQRMEYPAKILEHVEARREYAIDFLRRMVNFDSSTIDHGFGGREQAIQEWLAERLAEWGFETRLFEPDNTKMQDYPDFSRGHDYRNRPNLVATLKGAGGGRSLILNGHVDTMPPGAKEKWSYDPWAGHIQGGDMIGLGVCDMKAGVAAMILAVRFLQEVGLQLNGDVMIQSVVDEEGGGNGTLACVVEGYKADAAIVTEPTRLHVQPATRGVLLLQVDVEGRATHACLKWGGVNAIEKGVKVIQGMIELERLWLAQRRNPLFPPPTITIGQIQGGLAGSQVPGDCVLKFDVKYLPVEMGPHGQEQKITGDMVKQEVENWIHTLCAGDIWLRDHLPGLSWYQHCIPHYLDPQHALVHMMRGHVQQVVGRGIISGFPAGCDARHLHNGAGIPTLVFGPGDLQYAHSIDERVSLEEYMQAIKVLALTTYQWTCQNQS